MRHCFILLAVRYLSAITMASACLNIGCSSDSVLATSGANLPESACGRGLALVNSDYQSSSVALIGANGEVASAHFISSGSTPPTLSAALSGDVALPSTRVLGDEAILIDRYPASVLSWVTLTSAEVRAQLDVSTGFAANPQDVVQLDDGRSYVSRLDSNPLPGEQPFDQGGDILIVDSAAPAILARIDLSAAISDAPGYLPRPNAMVRLGESVAVLLSAYDASFSDAAPSRLVRIDPHTDSIIGVTILDGLYGCAALAAAPTEPARVAISCSGRFGGGSLPDLHESALVIVAADGQIEQQVGAAKLGNQPLGLTLDWLDAERVLVVALGSFESEPAITDALIELDLVSGVSREVLRSPTRPFELGQLRCMHRVNDAPDAPGCDQCWLPDGERGLLVRLNASAQGAEVAGQLRIDDHIGLPPRSLGRL